MLWIAATLLAAAGNALWVALSQSLLRRTSSERFTLVFRLLLAAWLAPSLAWACWKAGASGLASLPAIFWVAVGLVGAAETLGIVFQGIGVRHDYYTTFALGNTSPAALLVLAPMAVWLVPGFPPEAWGHWTVHGTVLIVAGILVLAKGGGSLAGVVWGALTTLMMAVQSLALRWGAAGCRTPENEAWLVYVLTCPSVLAGAAGLGLAMALRRAAPRKPSDKPGVSDSSASSRKTSRLLFALTSGVGALSTVAYNLAQMWAPSATQPTALVRLNLFFGFALSYWMLGERKRGALRLASGLLIALGAVLVVL